MPMEGKILNRLGWGVPEGGRVSTSDLMWSWSALRTEGMRLEQSSVRGRAERSL